MNDFLALGADGLGTPALVAVSGLATFIGGFCTVEETSVQVEWIVKISESSAGLFLNGNSVMLRSRFLNQMCR